MTGQFNIVENLMTKCGHLVVDSRFHRKQMDCSQERSIRITSCLSKDYTYGVVLNTFQTERSWVPIPVKAGILNFVVFFLTLLIIICPLDHEVWKVYFSFLLLIIMMRIWHRLLTCKWCRLNVSSNWIFKSKPNFNLTKTTYIHTYNNV